MYYKETTVKITKSLGINTRLITSIISKAFEFKSEIWIEKDGKKASAKSLLSTLELGIGNGENIKFIAEGIDEFEAVNALVEIVTSDCT